MQAWYHCEATIRLCRRSAGRGGSGARQPAPTATATQKLSRSSSRNVSDEHLLRDELGINIVSIEHHSGIKSCGARR